MDPEKGSVMLQIEVCFLTNCKDLQVPDIERIHLKSAIQYICGKKQVVVVYGITLTNILTQVVFLPSLRFLNVML